MREQEASDDRQAKLGEGDDRGSGAHDSQRRDAGTHAWVAAYVDKTIRTIMNSGAVVESSRAAILAALQITDELFRARNAQHELNASMDALSAEVRRWLPPAKR
jgi:hypothetical protein